MTRSVLSRTPTGETVVYRETVEERNRALADAAKAVRVVYSAGQIATIAAGIG